MKDIQLHNDFIMKSSFFDTSLSLFGEMLCVVYFILHKVIIDLKLMDPFRITAEQIWHHN